MNEEDSGAEAGPSIGLAETTDVTSTSTTEGKNNAVGALVLALMQTKQTVPSSPLGCTCRTVPNRSTISITPTSLTIKRRWPIPRCGDENKTRETVYSENATTAASSCTLSEAGSFEAPEW
jgi:hypothetical protein